MSGALMKDEDNPAEYTGSTVLSKLVEMGNITERGL